jgi:hypothetical protein
MEIIPKKNKLQKELPWAIKLIIPIKKCLKANQYKRKLNYVIMDYDKTCDNICQRNMGTKRIYEKKISTN